MLAVSASVAAFVTAMGGFAVRDHVAAASVDLDTSTDTTSDTSTDTSDDSYVYGQFDTGSSATPGLVAPSGPSDSFSSAS